MKKIREKRTWLILGSSSRIGREFARLAGKDGHQIILSGRDLEDLETISADLKARYNTSAKYYKLDILDIKRLKEFVGKVLEAAEHNISIFCTIGIGTSNEEAMEDVNKLKDLINTNYLGIAALLNLFIPRFKLQESGEIIVMGSYSGDIALKKNYLYGSSKAGLHLYLNGLRKELFPIGVSVTTVKGRMIDSRMHWGQTQKNFSLIKAKRAAEIVYKYGSIGIDMLYVPWYFSVTGTILKFMPQILLKRFKL